MISHASLMGALVVAAPCIMIAGALFWRSLRPIFWFACALIVVGTSYLMAIGATEDIARLIWPTFDSARRRDLEARFVRDFGNIAGATLIILPLWLGLAWVSWRRRAVPLFASIFFAGCYIGLLISPISERVARLVFSDQFLSGPAEQLKARQSSQLEGPRK